jgi:hypothetical protein
LTKANVEVHQPENIQRKIKKKKSLQVVDDLETLREKGELREASKQDALLVGSSDLKVTDVDDLVLEGGENDGMNLNSAYTANWARSW